MSDLKVTDPTYLPETNPNFLERWAIRLIKDPRDLPFLKLSLGLTLLFPPMAVHLFWPGQFAWWKAGVYWALELYMLGPYILMLHNTSHRTLFRPGYRFLNHYIPWVLGPFFGETPETYFAHHMGMHHAENNLPDDLSTTMPYRRDSVRGFLLYYLRFIFGGIVSLGRYFAVRGRKKLLRRVLIGELGYWCVVGGLLWVDWRAALVVFVIPVFTSRFLMMAGNWAQHAFIDPLDPASPYKNSITCINSVYNRRCFNDGYHIGHHVKPNRHWTEMPDDFLSNRRVYADADAIVFRNVDYFLIWFLLMAKAYKTLARFYVPLDDKNRSPEEIVALLRARTRPIEAAAT